MIPTLSLIPARYFHLSADRSHPEPLHHVLLNLTISRDVQDESAGQVSFVITHEDVFVLDVFQHQQLRKECLLKSQFASGKMDYFCH